MWYIDPKVQAEWEQRLVSEGLGVYEAEDGTLRGPPAVNKKTNPGSYTRVAFDARRRYYEVAEQLLWRTPRSGKHAFAYQVKLKHAFGCANTDIQRALGASPSAVRRVVNAFRDKIIKEILREKTEDGQSGAA